MNKDREAIRQRLKQFSVDELKLIQKALAKLQKKGKSKKKK